MTHQIKKTYVGYPSKNSVDFTGTEQECKDYLAYQCESSKRNGADVVEEDENHYTCDNYDSNNATVIFQIEEV